MIRENTCYAALKDGGETVIVVREMFEQHHCGDAVRDYVLVIPVATPRRVFRAHESDSYREKVIAGRFDAA